LHPERKGRALSATAGGARHQGGVMPRTNRRGEKAARCDAARRSAATDQQLPRRSRRHQRLGENQIARARRHARERARRVSFLHPQEVGACWTQVPQAPNAIPAPLEFRKWMSDMRIDSCFSPRSTASSKFIMNGQPVLLLAAWRTLKVRQAANAHQEPLA